MSFDKDKPPASDSLRESNPQILANYSQLQTAVNNEHIFSGTAAATQTGDHTQGSARAFFQDGTPATRIDGAGFLSTDLGSLWVDSNSSPDNQFNILTATAPTWTPVSTEIIATLLGAARIFAGTLRSDGTFTVGATKFQVAGTTGNTIIAGTLDVTGNIDPTTYETTNGGFLDEDDLSSDAADKIASQQSIKAYTDGSGIVQIVHVQDGDVATGTTVIPYDNTIPQNTEGDEYMTLAITPTSATNKLRIDVVVHGEHSATAHHTAALFQDSVANALAVADNFNGGRPSIVPTFTHFMTAGTTSETIFKVRAGGDTAGTFTFNGTTGGRRYGGVLASAITITEIKA